ncbi:MAG: leucine-rich repeat protein [Lachnospiraceae bacterium]|nr:leucine-rich repeat protein [Lachnospiraceae bacterium]
MFGKRTKKLLAMFCIALMIFVTVGEHAAVAMAAEDTTPSVTEETSETTEVISSENSEIENSETISEVGSEEEALQPIILEEIAPLESEPVIEAEDVVASSVEEGVLTIDASVTSISYLDLSGYSFHTLRFEEGSLLTVIKEGAFAGMENLLEVDFSNCAQLTDIEKNAFKGCTALTTVTLSDSLQTIGISAFENCGLTEITLTQGLISIGSYAFKGCGSLTEVIVNANNISCASAIGIFQNCDITEISFANNNTVVPAGLFCSARFHDEETDANDAVITIPYFIQGIGVNAFKSSNLQNVIFENTESKTSALSSIGKAAFMGCNKLNNVTFPSSLKTIEQEAFKECKAMTEISIPDSVSNIGKEAFSTCTDVETLRLSNATDNLGSGIFKNCSSLLEVEIPYGVTYISSNEFEGCVSLAEVTIANSVLEIQSSAFKDCVSLNGITIPNSVETLGQSAFQGCILLNEPVLSSKITVIPNSLFAGCMSLKTVIFEGKSESENDIMEIPAGITEIGASAFLDCKIEKKLIIPNTVTKIGASAFQGNTIGTLDLKANNLVTCGAGIFKECYINNVIFPTGIETIPARLFNEAHFVSGTTVTIPASVTNVGTFAFAGSNATPNNISNIKFEDGSLLNTIGANAFQYCTAIQEFDIPDTTVTIGNNAFAYCIKLQEITIPENVTAIGTGAFSDCEVLTTVKYNAIAVTTKAQNIFKNCNIHTIILGEKVQIIPAYLFYGAKFSVNQNTEEVVYVTITIPASVKEIGEYSFTSIVNISSLLFEENSILEKVGVSAFEGCTSLAQCELTETVITIGNSAFKGCAALETFTLPASLETMGSYAFSGCEKVTSYVIPASVTEIPTYAFNENTALEEVTFAGDNVTSIGNNAFYNCDALIEIKIPQGVETLGDFAFYGCEALEKITIPASVTSIGNDTFTGCTNAAFYVVKGSYAETWLKNKGLLPENLTAINYVLNGGENDPRNIAGYEAGDEFTFYPATKAGYAFEGWYLDEEFNTEIKNLNGCTGELTLYAKWSQDSYTITYVLDGGINHEENPDKYSIEDAFVFKNATKTGYTFAGWFTDDAFKTKITAITEGSSGNLTLYAKWTAIKYTIAFNRNGGTGSITSLYPVADASFMLPTEGFTRKGYTLVGWNTASDGSGTSYELGQMVSAISTSSSVTLYAQWKANSYMVYFDANGGQCDELSRELAFNSKYGTLPVATCEGYTLDGWYTALEGGDKIKDTTTFANDTDTTLYARWKANTYKLTFDANGGKLSSTSAKTVTYGQTYGINLVTATKDGYAFDGWYTESDELITADSIVTIASDHTLIAHWRSNVTAETPVANYESGSELFAGTKIMLVTETPGATIYYTVDGEIPTAESNRYVDAIVLDAPVVIKAIAVKEGYNDSAVAEFSYTVVDETQYWGDVAEEDRAQFADASEVPDSIWVAGVKDATYTGKAITFTLRVYDHKTLLKEKTDYTVKYSNNKVAADTSAKKAPAVTITAKGSYKGKAVVKFNILPRDINGGEFTADDMYAVTGSKAQKPVPVLMYGTTKLKNKKDYTVSYPEAYANGFTADGDYIITLKGTGNFTGSREVKFELKTKTSIAKASVVYAKSVTYTGEAIQPDVTVKVGKTTLTKGTDYEVTYGPNVEVGTGTITIQGVNSYIGVKKVTFKIAPVATMNKTKITFNKTSVEFTGKEIKLNEGANPLTATVMLKETKLVQDKDYIISGYTKNKDAGTATVMFTGIGAYSGTVKKTFKITPATLSANDIAFVDNAGNVISDAEAKYAFVKGGCKPEICLTYGDVVYKKGTDYTLSYKNNTKTGAATIIVKGKKNFKGSITKTFTVMQQDISNMSILVQDVVYQDAEGIYPVKPVIKDLDGKALASGKDYKASFAYTYAKDCYVKVNKKSVFRKAGSKVEAKDILSEDTVIKVTVSGTGNYTGEISAVYRIVKASIAKAKVTVAKQYYTGKSVEPGKDQLTVKVGSAVLNKTDYEIVGYSYNVAKGTATVTLRGTGNYGGEITVKFKIEQKNFILRLLGL